jgi:hypothetical protein
MTTINNYKTNKKCRQWQRLYSCHTKRKVHTIKKMILDTAVTSEDLSHTTRKNKSM